MSANRGHSRAFFACEFLAAMTLNPLIARSQTTASTSITTSNSSDWMSASSGWNNEEAAYGAVPVGTWKLRYNHFFAPAGPTTGLVTFATPAKPTAAAWANTPKYKNNTSTTSTAGSTATSEWYINTYKSVFPINPFFYADYSTRSKASAEAPDTTATSRTRIVDPWTFVNPGGDPDGHWRIKCEVALWGSLEHNDLADGSMSFTYGLTRNSLGGDEPAESLLDILIGGTKTTITPNSSLVAQNRLLFTDINGGPMTVDELIDAIDTHRTSSGWSLSPGLDIDDFHPDDPAYLSQVFKFNMYVLLDSTDSTAAIFTDHGSSASAVVPEPATLGFVLIGAALLRAAGRRRAVDQPGIGGDKGRM